MVQFRYIHIEFQNNYDQDGTEIMGIVSPRLLLRGPGPGHHLLRRHIRRPGPLTDEQMLAEQAMLAMATEEF